MFIFVYVLNFPIFQLEQLYLAALFCTCCCVIMLNPIILTKSHASPSQIIVFVCLSFFRSIVNSVSRITHIITSHGENGSRPQRPLYPRNNDRVHFILHKILYYNTTVSDAMKICFVIIHHVLIDPEFI